MDTQLQEFMRAAIASRQSKETITSALTTGQWTADEIQDALSAYTDVGIGIAVPVRKPYVSAREAFMYLVMFVTLYISAFSAGTILFQFVNKLFPDPAFGNVYEDQSIADAIRSSLSALIVGFPIFLWMSRSLLRSLAIEPVKRGSRIRKWLTNLTLFIASSIIIGDLIALVYNVLSGELTMRFFLKCAIVAGMSAGIFGYYLWDLKKDDNEHL